MNDIPLEISCAEVKAQLDAADDFLLLDCREAEEHALVSIGQSTLLPMSEMQARVGELEQHRTRSVVVFCHHGMRSAQVANWLRERGFTHVQSMAGGIDRWATEIDPRMERY